MIWKVEANEQSVPYDKVMVTVVCFSDRPDETVVPRGKSREILIPERGLKKFGALLSLLLAGVFQ